MERKTKTLVCSGLLALAVTLSATGAQAAEVVVLHADSLAGPMRALKSAFEAKNPGVTLNLTPGVSRELAERIVRARPATSSRPRARRSSTRT